MWLSIFLEYIFLLSVHAAYLMVGEFQKERRKKKEYKKKIRQNIS